MPAVMARYPAASITPAEFERFVVEVFGAVGPLVDELEVTLHPRVAGPDGAYDLDGMIRLRWGGLDLVVVLEAKRHRHPIRRQDVQVLHAKVQSTGAHKGVLIATAPFQRGALDYATAHGIALITVTEGRFTVEVNSGDPPRPPSRARAWAVHGVPALVGHCYGPGDAPGAASVTVVSAERPELIRDRVLGLG